MASKKKPIAPNNLPPSRGTPGEASGIGDCPRAGRGKGLFAGRAKDPHPNPFPVYREREEEKTDPPLLPPFARQWTPEQWLGITTVGHSLLVSAAAGSGKTAMLSERCAYLVCDAPEPCDVDELLVVTFTDAAAGEMKSRVTQALRSRAERQSAGRAPQQLKLVDGAHVSTLHSFCSRVLRQHFHLIGLDPAFAVLDGEEAKLLRGEVARTVFADEYEMDDDGSFQQFVDAYGDGDDERLIRLVIRAHDMLTSLVDPEGWIAGARARLEQAARMPLDESEMGQALRKLIACELDVLAQRCDRAVDQMRRLDGFDKYLAVLQDARQIILHWGKVFRDSGLSALKEESEITFDRLPAVPNSVPNKTLAKAAVDSVRDAMTKGLWRELLRFSPDEWTQGLRAILPHAGVFLRLVERFEKAYREEKNKARALDFADLERFTLNVLRDPTSPGLTPSPAARSFHRRFKHVLVDEYQDINEVQDAILTLVSRECLVGKAEGGRMKAEGRHHTPSAFRLQTSDFRPNLFCVGDVKQSIYRFRLAEAGRFLQRQEQFRADGGKRMGSVIDLQKNFRSRAPLLDAINGVFTRLMTGDAVDITYDVSHLLHAGAQYPAADGTGTFTGTPIEMHVLPAVLERAAASDPDEKDDCDDVDEAGLDRAEREAVLIARRIREMTGLNGKPPMSVTEKGTAGAYQSRPMQFRDVVILLRSMKFKADQYAEVLRQNGIPVHSESGVGYFESTEVSDVLSLLSLLNNSRQDVPLAATLRSPLTAFPDPENSLVRIRLASSVDSGIAFHEAVSKYPDEHDDELAGAVRKVLHKLSDWRELAQRRPLADVIQHIYEQTGYLAYVAGLPSGEQRVANLEYLLDRARQFGTFHRQGLARFMHFIDNLRNESDLGQPSIASEAEDVVRIMSVHRSKGLEFPVVFLPDLGKAINLDDCGGPILLDRQTGLGMSVVDETKKVRYPSLALALVRARLRQQTLAEEMRVLYVAMTRAKEHLVLIGTAPADADEKWRAAWAGHVGPLPNDLVLGATTMLGWLGPVAAASGQSGEIIRIHAHSSDEVATWNTETKRRPSLTAEQEKLARLEPLDPAPPPNADASNLIARLTATYPYEPFTRLKATEAVSDRTNDNFEGRASATRTVSLEQPRFILEAGVLSAADIGEATHLVLEHLDFRQLCDRANLTEQIAKLVERRLIAAAQAKSVDLDGLAWLFTSEAGQLLRDNPKRVLRELPVYLADQRLESPDPLDHVMLRGRIDALVPMPEGNVLIDYKTDRIRPEHIAAHAETYRAQVAGYRRAVEAITGEPVRQVLLVFLAARVVHAIER